MANLPMHLKIILIHNLEQISENNCLTGSQLRLEQGNPALQ